MVKNAGIAWLTSSHGMFFDSPIIMEPTSMRTGAVAVGGTEPSRGAKKRDRRNRKPIVHAVRPVRPPWGTALCVD